MPFLALIELQSIICSSPRLLYEEFTGERFTVNEVDFPTWLHTFHGTLLPITDRVYKARIGHHIDADCTRLELDGVLHDFFCLRPSFPPA